MGIINSVGIGLSKFSGEDYTIIQKCNRKIQVDFALIGFLVVIILMCCFVSALYFTDKLFHNYFADILVGLVWGYVVTNLYILLLYTISPVLLPKKVGKNGKKINSDKFQISFSMTLRILMVILLAVTIAQPLNVLFLKSESMTFAFDIKNLLATNPLATVNTVFIVFLFLLPIYLKYNIRKLEEFYEKKAEIKRRIIEDDYSDFKVIYKQILENRIIYYNKSVTQNLFVMLNKLELINPIAIEKIYLDIKEELVNENIEKYEYWGNPPFRTEYNQKKSVFLSEKDFLTYIYPESD